MNKIFNQAWKYFAGCAIVLAYTAWYERLKTPQKTSEFKKEIKSQFDYVKNQISELQEQISSSLDEETNNEVEKAKELTNDLKNMERIHKNYFDKFENGNVSTDPKDSIELYNKYKAQIDETFSKANNKAKEIIDILDNTKEKIMDNNTIFNVINEFKEYLDSLSAMEICLIINISSCVFILTCIISIIFAISGNYLIDKFSLEHKLPKLSKIIQLRVKFQHYYAIINLVFIILAILSLILVNTITLINV